MKNEDFGCPPNFSKKMSGQWLCQTQEILYVSVKRTMTNFKKCNTAWKQQNYVLTITLIFCLAFVQFFAITRSHGVRKIHYSVRIRLDSANGTEPTLVCVVINRFVDVVCYAIAYVRNGCSTVFTTLSLNAIPLSCPRI